MRELYDNMYKHNLNVSTFATKDSDAERLIPIKEDFRPPYFRDIDKIIYSSAYFRYIDKTQVFSFESNDMISRRMTHIQLVSKIARTIGRGLNLNEDLIEAASLGHDLGHTPFGHVGEKFLNNLSLKHNEGYFNHNVQSVRTLMDIENSGKGCNITLQVLDAILCHNGEELQKIYIPRKKAKGEFIKEYEKCYKDKDALKNLCPMTLEGCVVRISDVIAYMGRDIEDAVRLNKIELSSIPNNVKNILGATNSDIINTIVIDIIENSMNKNYIKLSDKVYFAMQELIAFNYKNVYGVANTKERLSEIETMFNKLFNLYLEDVRNDNKNSDIYLNFLNTMSDEYKRKTSEIRKVIDYIAGRTDGYFVRQYTKHFIDTH